MKIVLIGPVYPYKGGISHYTGLLCKALRLRHQVEMVSYKMQYPKLLFKKEQKDYSNKSFEVENVRYLLHTADPFNIIRTAHKIDRQDPDVVIIQWWHPYFAPCYAILTTLLKKHKILFVCHNVYPHERFPMDRMLTKLALRGGRYFVVQSHQDEQDLLTVLKRPNYVVTPHPTYNAFQMQKLGRAAARELLEIQEDTPVLLFFGFVRKYKGLQYLLQAMPKISRQLPAVQLWVVGDFGEDRDEYFRLMNELQIEKSVRVADGYVPDTDVEKYFAAADLVVLPYLSATQSGIVQIAYGFEKPVVVTNVGGLPDVVEDNETGYVVEKEDPTALAEAVIRFFAEGQKHDWAGSIRKKTEEFSWETMTRRIEELLER